jgi:neutral ceramidase
MSGTLKTAGRFCMIVALVLAGTLGAPGLAGAAESPWRIGLAKVRITPRKPIRMAGYASRSKPSEGVLAELYAKAMAIEEADGHRAVLITSDVIGYRAAVAEMICRRIMAKTGLTRPQILLSCSHTHTGPMLGIAGSTGYALSEAEQQVVHQYTERLAGQLVELTAAALADLRPAKLSWGIGVANFVMNRREFAPGGVRLGVNPRGYADRSVPVLRVDSAEGELRAVVFACACHNTTLTGQHYVLSGDYAGFAQQYVEEHHPEAQAMFMIGCGADANPYPRSTVEAVRRHGQELGWEVCRVLGGKLAPVGGLLRVVLEDADLPLQPVPSRQRLEQMARGPSYIAYNAQRMIEALDAHQALPKHYQAPVAVWQFGDELTMIGLPGEVVAEYVPLLETALGHRNLWIAGYCNDCFGYLPTAKILAEGGYETRCLIAEPGFFSPKVEGVLVAKVRQLAERAGREVPR